MDEAAVAIWLRFWCECRGRRWLQQRTETGTHEGLVVGEQDPDGGHRSSVSDRRVGSCVSSGRFAAGAVYLECPARAADGPFGGTRLRTTRPG